MFLWEYGTLYFDFTAINYELVVGCLVFNDAFSTNRPYRAMSM